MGTGKKMIAEIIINSNAGSDDVKGFFINAEVHKLQGNFHTVFRKTCVQLSSTRRFFFFLNLCSNCNSLVGKLSIILYPFSFMSVCRYTESCSVCTGTWFGIFGPSCSSK